MSCWAALVGRGLERHRLQLVRQLKNRQSRRAVLLPALAATALVDHRARQAAEREQQAGCWEEHGLVFPNTVGRPLNPDNLQQRSFFRCLLALAYHASAPRPAP